MLLASASKTHNQHVSQTVLLFDTVKLVSQFYCHDWGTHPTAVAQHSRQVIQTAHTMSHSIILLPDNASPLHAASCVSFCLS
jgi:hypothetical protein